MPIRIAPSVMETRQKFNEQIGLGPQEAEFVQALIDMLAPAAGPSGFATGIMQPPNQIPQTPAPSMREMALRAANPLYGVIKGAAENPALAMSAIPLILGRRASAGQKEFKQTAKQLRGRLKGSAVRDQRGLKRVYHGTPRAFEQFDPLVRGTGSGGDLYGPGYYFTENPEIAGGSKRSKSVKNLGYATPPGDSDAAILKTFTSRDEAEKYLSTLGPGHGIFPSWHGKIHVFRKMEPAPNVRPAYLDIRKPFDVEKGRLTQEQLKQIGWEGVYGSANGDLQRILDNRPDLKPDLPEKLKILGYDGITHIGGSGENQHRVWIAFSPEQVIPAFAKGAPTNFRPKKAKRVMK